jgi:4a-hydroxytetrahydrobiopterin dehydratase
LSQKDLEMADICDAIAQDFGELEPEPVSCDLRDVAGKATVSAGDCCAPKES